nr:Dyp-type peroxidase domain-containing protein [Mesorhizobium sp. LNHC221B00]
MRRKKLSDIELDDAIKPTSGPQCADHDYRARRAVGDCTPQHAVGDVGKGEFGTYFIGYARSPRRIEQMLENMFIGGPQGNYDRLLDFSRAVTGTLFLIPSATFLESVATGQAVIDRWPESVGPTYSEASPFGSPDHTREYERNGLANQLLIY